ncbi:MAG: cobalamin-binding protein [Phycisphaerales bacterium]|nr:MAG: cobalamin-binding protein [Phycisphaerales bacterium]
MAATRIASTLASGTEILFALGLGERVVAVSHECDYPPAVNALPRITRSRVDGRASSSEIDRQVRALAGRGEPLYEIDLQRLSSLKPDLIVAQSHCDVCAVSGDDVRRAIAAAPASAETPSTAETPASAATPTLTASPAFTAMPELAATKVVDLNAATLSGLFDDIRRVGRMAGGNSRATNLIEALRGRIEAVAARTRPLQPTARPRTACIEWIEPLSLAANWMPDLLDLAGGRCELTASGQRSGFTGWETIRAFEPQVIVVMPCGFDLERTLEAAGVLTSQDGWDALPAVRRRRVWAMDGNAYFNRSGPRLIDSVELLAHILHPELFPQFARLCASAARRM